MSSLSKTALLYLKHSYAIEQAREAFLADIKNIWGLNKNQGEIKTFKQDGSYHITIDKGIEFWFDPKDNHILIGFSDWGSRPKPKTIKYLGSKGGTLEDHKNWYYYEEKVSYKDLENKLSKFLQMFKDLYKRDN
jgi:hypothetical protein